MIGGAGYGGGAINRSSSGTLAMGAIVAPLVTGFIVVHLVMVIMVVGGHISMPRETQVMGAILGCLVGAWKWVPY